MSVMSSHTPQLAWITNFIWGIADDVLRDVYVRGKYRDVILPMVVIRRLDALLEPTKEQVLDTKKRLDEAGVANQSVALKQAAGQAFYNASPFTLRDLRSRTKVSQLKSDFEAYLDGFSDNVQEILDKFKFRNQIQTLVDADILGALIEKFLDPKVNITPRPVLNNDGSERLPALDNHAMGTIFEELIRRFNEENNEEAGEHFTPRDVVTLMAELIFRPIADEIRDGTYTVYDAACGTGGMLTVAEDRLRDLAKEIKELKEKHERADDGVPVIKKIHKGNVPPDPMSGLFEAIIAGKSVVVEYEADSDLRDTENVPLLEEGGTEAFIRREVLPHVPDAWIVADKVQIGYEISFTRYFYKPKPMRTLEEIRRDIEALERETDGLLDKVLMEVEK